MKISSFSAVFLAAATPFAAAAGLKGTERQLQTCPEQMCGRNSVAHFPAPRFDLENLPTLEELDAYYGTFCSFCEIGEILNPDIQFCDALCSFEIPDIEIPDFSEITTCFSEVSTVQVENVGSVTMKDLKVGARVLTANGIFEPVYAFGHKNAGLSAEFLQFNGGLEMTGAHLVFVEGKTNPVRADSVKVGDVLRGQTDAVRNIKTITRTGVYSPLTPSGTVVVDGIVASSYISLQKGSNEYVQMQGGFAIMSYQDFIHMALSPFRMFTMGVSSAMGNTYTEDGLPTFAAAGINLGQWADSQNILVQAVLLVAFIAIAGASMVVENTFGPSLAPLALAAGAGAYALMKNNDVTFRASKIKSV